MLLTVSREYGGSINQELRNDSDFHSQPPLGRSFNEITCGACQVTYEATSPPSVGALRTGRLLGGAPSTEIAVVGNVLHDPPTVRSYVRRAIRSSASATSRPGEQPGTMSGVMRASRPMSLFGLKIYWLSLEASAEFSTCSTALVLHFEDQYGWASQGHSRQKGITFADIERCWGGSSAAALSARLPSTFMRTHEVPSTDWACRMSLCYWQG